MRRSDAKKGLCVLFVAGDVGIEEKIRELLPDSDIWRMAEKLEGRVAQLLDTELYGNSTADVCGELICRGIEAAIAKGTIRS